MRRAPTWASSRPAIPDLLPFVQLELAGTAGLDEGRYLARAGQEGDPERVLVVQVAGAPPPPRRRFGRARPKPPSDESGTAQVPLTTLTAIRAQPLGGAAEAVAWLERLRNDEEARDGELAAALHLINRAVHAHRAAVLDPALADVTAERALAIRIGYGEGEPLADGRFTQAIELPLGSKPRRGEALRPQERLAAVLGGREGVAACELLLIRARADLDAGRARECALQLRVGLEALLAERDAFAAPGQDEDLAALDARRSVTGEAANEALRGPLGEMRLAEVTETLRLCERVMRRKRALG